MALKIIKPYAPPMHEIEVFEYEPVLTDKERANFLERIELRRLDISGRSARLRPLVGETAHPPIGL